MEQEGVERKKGETLGRSELFIYFCRRNIARLCSSTNRM